MALGAGVAKKICNELVKRELPVLRRGVESLTDINAAALARFEPAARFQVLKSRADRVGVNP